jgi:hypothetical protein
MKEQLMGLLQTLLYGLGNIGVAAILYYVKVAVDKAKAETAKIQNADQKALADAAIERLQDLAKVTVSSIQETVGKETKQLFLDGKVDRNELVALSTQAKDEILAHLSEDAKSVLSAEVGDLNLYVEKVIEATLADLKAKV